MRIIMIKFKAVNSQTKTEFYGFGLSERNIMSLKNGEPIYLAGDKIGSVYDYLIFYGETEEKMFNTLKKFIGPETYLNKESD